MTEDNMSAVTRCVLVVLAALIVIGCSPEKHATGSIGAKANVTTTFDPTDWGPAYVNGMENGPASLEHSRAMYKAEQFMIQQKFANQYAKRACAVGGSDLIDVSFALLSDMTGKTRGIVRMNLKTAKCSWVGPKVKV